MRVTVETPRGEFLKGYLIGKHSFPLSSGKEVEKCTIHLDRGDVVTVNSSRVKVEGEDGAKLAMAVVYGLVAIGVLTLLMILVDSLSHFFLFVWDFLHR